MTEKLWQHAVLVFAFCLVFAAAPVFAQQEDNELMWRDENGNIHFRDEDGNYMIDKVDSNDSNVTREPQTQLDDRAGDQDELPATAGEVPLLGLIGMLSLAGGRQGILELAALVRVRRERKFQRNGETFNAQLSMSFSEVLRAASLIGGPSGGIFNKDKREAPP
jgi:hypothetical protein